jgi:hypothetical protein
VHQSREDVEQWWMQMKVLILMNGGGLRAFEDGPCGRQSASEAFLSLTAKFTSDGVMVAPLNFSSVYDGLIAESRNDDGDVVMLARLTVEE